MNPLIPVGVAAGLAAYCWATRRLKRAAQPLRLQLAEKGERLLGDANLPIELRGFVKFLLETAFNNQISLLLGIFAVPVIACFIMFVPGRVNTLLDRFVVANPSTRAAFDEVMRLHDRITFLNHPIMLFIVELEILLFVPIAILISGVVREIVPESVTRNTAMDLIEAAGITVRSLLGRRLAFLPVT